ncbi:hypothetical protein CMK18_11915 [Candidatus Poribacteria bacterium]|nr:hypothetical protein [Candidatus Poribacteria bacterium]
MDDMMRDTFAQQGYIIVPNVLDQDQLDELNEVYNQKINEQEYVWSKNRTDKKSASPSDDVILTRRQIDTEIPTQEEDSGVKLIGT